MRQKAKSLLLPLISVALMLAVSAPIVLAQDEYLPPDDLDIEPVAQMLDRVEFFARECTRYKCPKLDCNTAGELHRQLYVLRKEAQLYAFWFSKTPEFSRVERAKTRYQKVTAIFRRLDGLLRQGAVQHGGASSFANCLLKLSPACGKLLDNPERDGITSALLIGGKRGLARDRARERRYIPDYEQVKFTSSGEPLDGTANHPEVWRRGVDVYLQALKRNSFFLATFPVPERDEMWVEISKRSFYPSEKISVRYSTNRCCGNRLMLQFFSGDRMRDYLPLKLDRREREIDRPDSETAVIIAPETPGEYELRLSDPDIPNDFAFAEFEVRVPAPNLDLVGKWKTDDGLEVAVSRNGDELVGRISKLGKINDIRKSRRLAVGAQLWRVFSEDPSEDGLTRYRFLCHPDLASAGGTEWHSFEVTMESLDSFLFPSTTCRISPLQTNGLVRLSRVRGGQ